MNEEPLAKAIAEMCDCAHSLGMSWAAVHEAMADAVGMTLQMVDHYDEHSPEANLLTWIGHAISVAEIGAEEAAEMRASLEKVLKGPFG